MAEILVVDDSRVMREMIVACLRPLAGATFTHAASGLEAIDAMTGIIPERDYRLPIATHSPENLTTKTRRHEEQTETLKFDAQRHCIDRFASHQFRLCIY